MSVSEHEVEIVSRFTEGGYRAFCSCGWESAKWNGVEDAMDQWSDHCDEVFMEATMRGPYDD